MSTLQQCWVYDYKHLICLYHSMSTGHRYVLLNFHEIPSSVGYSSYLISVSDKIIFQIDEHTTVVIEITNAMLGTPTYTCIVGDMPLPPEPLELKSTPVYTISVDSYVNITNAPGDEKVTWYLLETTRSSDGLKTQVHRRFREFVDVDATVRYVLKTDALPALPSDLKLLTDHFAPEFLDSRKKSLDQYLSVLVRLPFIEHVHHFTYFGGLTAERFEFSLELSAAKIEDLFELTQNPGTDPITCTYFGFVHKIKDARRCLGLTLFDVVSAVNGTDVEGLHYIDVMQLLTKSSRPLIVHFLRALHTGSKMRVASVVSNDLMTYAAPSSAAQNPMMKISHAHAAQLGRQSLAVSRAPTQQQSIEDDAVSYDLVFQQDQADATATDASVETKPITELEAALPVLGDNPLAPVCDSTDSRRRSLTMGRPME